MDVLRQYKIVKSIETSNYSLILARRLTSTRYNVVLIRGNTVDWSPSDLLKAANDRFDRTLHSLQLTTADSIIQCGRNYEAN